MIRFIKDELCNGCGTCVRSCPMDVIRLDAGAEKAVIRYAQDCMACYNCERDCPVDGCIFVGPERSRNIALPW